MGMLTSSPYFLSNSYLSVTNCHKYVLVMRVNACSKEAVQLVECAVLNYIVAFFRKCTDLVC
jgi:hypothetical protein